MIDRRSVRTRPGTVPCIPMTQPTPDQPSPAPQRLVSLDALRGFDMLIILGIDDLAWRLREASPGPLTNVLSDQLSHVDWEGFRFLDLIFPLFIFLSGASATFSVSRGIELNGTSTTIRRLFQRFAVLYLLGLLYYGGLSEGFDHIRWVGVLQRIAAAGLVTGLLLCVARPAMRRMIASGILLADWALMCFVPVPGGIAGDFAQGPTHNWANWVDFQWLPGLKWDKTHDPEGLLSTLPAIATCILGSVCGEWLKRRDVNSTTKVLGLIAAGVALSAAGWLWGMHFPVIKKLWTSSYVLVAGGYSCLLLAAFYWAIDLRGWTTWCRPLVWIGMNAITLYLLGHFLKYEHLSKAVLGGPVSQAVAPFGPSLVAAGVVAISLILAWFLHSRRIFLRA